MAERSVLCLPVTSRNGEYLWAKQPAGAALLPGRDEPRDVVAWSSVGVSLEVGRLLEKGCVGQSTNSATPPQNTAQLLECFAVCFHVMERAFVCC